MSFVSRLASQNLVVGEAVKSKFTKSSSTLEGTKSLKLCDSEKLTGLEEPRGKSSKMNG